MKIIDPFFISYPEEDEQAAGHAQREPGDIDDWKSFVPDDVTKRDDGIMTEHAHRITGKKLSRWIQISDQTKNLESHRISAVLKNHVKDNRPEMLQGWAVAE